MLFVVFYYGNAALGARRSFQPPRILTHFICRIVIEISVRVARQEF